MIKVFNGKPTRYRRRCRKFQLEAKQSTNSRLRSSNSRSRSSKMLNLNRSCMSRTRGFLPSVDMTFRQHLVRHLGNRKLSRRNFMEIRGTKRCSNSRSRYNFMIPVSATRNVNTISKHKQTLTQTVN
jgi:hypothetical protein